MVSIAAVAQQITPIPRRTYDRWMDELQDEIGNRALPWIVIPGTHDAGTYGITENPPIYLDSIPDLDPLWSDVSGLVVAVPGLLETQIFNDAIVDWSRTQGSSIGRQLDDGIRMLDLRFCEDPMPGVHRFVIHHGAILGPDSFEVLNDIETFVREPGHEREIVILDLSHWCNFSDDDHREFAAILQQRFGDLLINRSFAAPERTLQDIWATGNRVLVIYESADRFLGSEEFYYENTLVDPQLFWTPDLVWESQPEPDPPNEPYHAPNLQDLIDEIMYGLENRPQHETGEKWLVDGLYGVPGTLTPDTPMVLCDLYYRLAVASNLLVVPFSWYLDDQGIECPVSPYHSVRGIASLINKHVTDTLYSWWLRGPHNLAKNLNFIRPDWYQYSNFVGAAIEMNRASMPPQLFVGYLASARNRLLSSVYGDYFGAEVLMPGSGHQGVSLSRHGGCLYESWAASNGRLFVARSCGDPWESGDWTGSVELPRGYQQYATSVPALASYEGCMFVAYAGTQFLDPGLFVTRNCHEPIEVPWPEPDRIPTSGQSDPDPETGVALANYGGCLIAAWRGPDEEDVCPPSRPLCDPWRRITMPGRLFISWNCSGQDWDEEAWAVPLDLTEMTGARTLSSPALLNAGTSLLLAYRANYEPNMPSLPENHVAILRASDVQQWDGPYVYDAMTEYGPALARHGDQIYMAWSGGSQAQVASAGIHAPLAFGQAVTVSSGVFSPIALAVSSNNPPEARCAPFVTCAGKASCTADADIDNGSSDPDGDSLTFTQNPPGPYDIGLHSVTLTVTDARGFSDTCTAVVAIEDCNAPVITCPADVTIECGDSLDPASTGMATAIDSCDPNPHHFYDDALTQGSCGGEWIYTRTWTAKDAAGNDDVCRQFIDVVDTTAPTIQCGIAPIATRRSSEDPPLVARAVASDACCAAHTMIVDSSCSSPDCDVEVVGDTLTINATGPVGSTISWSVQGSDCCGNQATRECSVTIVGPRTLLQYK